MPKSVYVGPPWPDGAPEPAPTSHFYCDNSACPGHAEVLPDTRKYKVPGGHVCELCAEAYDDESEN